MKVFRLLGGNYSSNLNRFTKLYRVMVQAALEYWLDTESPEQYVCA